MSPDPRANHPTQPAPYTKPLISYPQHINPKQDIPPPPLKPSPYNLPRRLQQFHLHSIRPKERNEHLDGNLVLLMKPDKRPLQKFRVKPQLMRDLELDSRLGQFLGWMDGEEEASFYFSEGLVFGDGR